MCPFWVLGLTDANTCPLALRGPQYPLWDMWRNICALKNSRALQVPNLHPGPPSN